MTLPLNQSDFITTFTGLRFSPHAPDRSDVYIEDIAHALSMLCRFTGHCREFYSVAEHSVHASRLVAPEFALEALLHDAAEAYISDLSRPLKHHPSMWKYRDVEARVDQTIRACYGLPKVMSPEVKLVDNQLVVAEARLLMQDSKWTEGHVAAPVQLNLWYPDDAEAEFLFAFYRLSKGAVHVQPEI